MAMPPVRVSLHAPRARTAPSTRTPDRARPDASELTADRERPRSIGESLEMPPDARGNGHAFGRIRASHLASFRRREPAPARGLTRDAAVSFSGSPSPLLV